MIIGIDGSEANEITRVGSSEYTYQLLKALYRISVMGKTKNEFRIFIKQSEINELPEENLHWRYEKLSSTHLWMIKKIVPRLLFGGKIDVFFSPTHYLPIFTSVPQVCTIHDLGYLMFSEQFKRYDYWQLKYWTAISIFISKYIISISNSTKKDIVRHYHFASNKVKTVYHGVDHDVYNDKITEHLVRHVKNKYKIANNYILSIGTLKPSKNIIGIIKSFGNLIKENEEIVRGYQLVIAGKKGWFYHEMFLLIEELKIQDKVIFTDYLAGDDKPALYKGARFLISPSFWEGFGMHVLEAMACGVPVISSRAGSLEEVAGSAGIFVDPYDISDITLKMRQLMMMDDKDYNNLVRKCISRASEFNWDKTAQETLNVLERINK